MTDDVPDGADLAALGGADSAKTEGRRTLTLE
jgi:hypothetical protein